MTGAATTTPKSSGPVPCLLFTVGEMRCHLELARLHSIAPWATLRAAEEEPDLLGWLNLRGEEIPVVDVGAMVYGVPTQRVLGSRILVLECTAVNGRKRLIGTLAGEVFAIGTAEEVVEFERFDPCELLSSLLKRLG